MVPKLAPVLAGFTAAMILGVASCSSESGPERTPPPHSTAVTATAGLRAPSERWADLPESQKSTVCVQAREAGGPDYRGMLRALMDAGLTQPDAAAMLPYAVNECL